MSESEPTVPFEPEADPPGRRSFLQLALGGVGVWALPPIVRAAPPYRVGVSRSFDPYGATRAAVGASGEWPAARIEGREVVIKVNLVGGLPAETGATTSPEVVQALVDLALDAGASRVSIIEGGLLGAPFSRCGYDLFRAYDPDGRVALVDLRSEGYVPVPVAAGTAYRGLYLSNSAVRPDCVFVSAAKLKTHEEGGASLSVKNLFGLPPIPPYLIPEGFAEPGDLALRARNSLHERAMNQAIADLGLARPVDYAVVDGIWGMEGPGPVSGTPVHSGIVVAGQNAVALDRVCLDAMSVPADRVPHLAYASWKGLGPSSLSEIERVGDPYTPMPFAQPESPPPVGQARAMPRVFSAARGERAVIAYRLGLASETRVQIVHTTDFPPSQTVVRTLRDWTPRPAGVQTVVWDGRDEAGELVAPGAWAIRTQARAAGGRLSSRAVGWVGVI